MTGNGVVTLSIIFVTFFVHQIAPSTQDPLKINFNDRVEARCRKQCEDYIIHMDLAFWFPFQEKDIRKICKDYDIYFDCIRYDCVYSDPKFSLTAKQLSFCNSTGKFMNTYRKHIPCIAFNAKSEKSKCVQTRVEKLRNRNFKRIESLEEAQMLNSWEQMQPDIDVSLLDCCVNTIDKECLLDSVKNMCLKPAASLVEEIFLDRRLYAIQRRECQRLNIPYYQNGHKWCMNAIQQQKNSTSSLRILRRAGHEPRLSLSSSKANGVPIWGTVTIVTLSFIGIMLITYGLVIFYRLKINGAKNEVPPSPEVSSKITHLF